MKKKNKTKEEKDDWRQEDDDNTFYSVDHPERRRDPRVPIKGVGESTDLHKAGVR